VQNRYHLREWILFLTSSEDQGSLSLADPEGITWRLVRLGRSERFPEGVKATAVFGDGRVSGSGGCYRSM
jgi:hypothetical protein